MIKEAYVSFEVAKLLGEKGFPFNEIEYPKAINNVGLFGDAAFIFGNAQMCNGSEILTCTHQMAIAWLREEKDFFIDILWTGYEREYSFCITNMIDGSSVESDTSYPVYGECSEAAIKYALENLI